MKVSLVSNLKKGKITSAKNDDVIPISGLCFKDSPKRKVYMTLTLREIEYLEYVREQDLAQYGDILRELKGEFHQNQDFLKELDNYIVSLPL